MKRISTLICLSLMLVFSAKAQKGDIKVGAALDVGIPLGNFGNGYGVGIGASGKGMYGIIDDGQVTFTLGFLRFGMKNSNDYASGSTVLIPLLPGYRHHFGQWYGEGQLGLTVVRSTVKIKESLYPGLGGTYSNTNFGYGIGGGYLYNNWDFGARFQGVAGNGGSLDFFALRAAYNFSLKFK